MNELVEAFRAAVSPNEYEVLRASAKHGLLTSDDFTDPYLDDCYCPIATLHGPKQAED